MSRHSIRARNSLAPRHRSLWAGFGLLALLIGWAGPSAAQDLLEADKAFVFSARAPDPQRIDVTWRIAPGYYMYRDKFRVVLVDGPVSLGPPDIPPGKTKIDEFFGEVSIHEGEVVVSVPVDRGAESGPTSVTIAAHGQGCNEPVGVCYPPLKRQATLQLTAAAPVSPVADTTFGSARSLRELLGGAAQPEFLPVDEAFRFDLAAVDGNSVELRFAIEPGYYLYRDKIEVASLDSRISVAALDLPPGRDKEDEYFGKVIAYYDGFSATAPLTRTHAGAMTAEFKVGYQGCAEKGICYPPVETRVAVELPELGNQETAAGAPPSSRAAGAGGGSMWGFVAAAFVTGLALTFTPCVLPMVPILSSIVVGQGVQTSKTRGGLLAAVYVAGTSVTWAAAGALAGATGDQLQAYFQNIWAIGVICLILVLLAFSMFGLYQIQMPDFIRSRLYRRTKDLRGGQFGVVFLLGLLSALIVGACVSPLLIAALGAAMVKGDIVLGATMMFAMAWGMGLFLIALGVGAGFVLPRAGPWMERVNYVFGVVLLGVAVYLLGAIPEVPVLYLWSGLLVISAVYLGALQPLPADALGWRYLSKGVGVFLLVWGVLALLGGMSGSRDIMRPVNLAAIPTLGPDNTVAQGQRVHFTRVASVRELNDRLAGARAASKSVLLDYYADWCVDCVRMERTTFQDPRVADALQRDFVLLQVDLTDPTDVDRRAIRRQFGVLGPPAMLFFDTRGTERSDLRRYGFVGPDEFLRHLARLDLDHA